MRNTPEETLSNVLRRASFGDIRTNGKGMIPFVVSLSNHERNRLIQRFPMVTRMAH